MAVRSHVLLWGALQEAADELEHIPVTVEDLRLALVNALKQIVFLEQRTESLEGHA